MSKINNRKEKYRKEKKEKEKDTSNQVNNKDSKGEIIKDGEHVNTTIRHIDREVWEFAKEFLRTTYGSYYAHLGELVSDALRHYFECVLGVSMNKNPLNTACVRKNLPDPKHSRKRMTLIKVCEKLIELEDEFTYSAKEIRGQIISAVEEFTGLAPTRWTVREYFDYLVDRGGLFRNAFTGEYKVVKSKLKEIIKNLEVKK